MTDSSTSLGVTKYITSTLAGEHVRYKKGYRYAMEKGHSMIENCGVSAVEYSGHGAWLDSGCVNDGCYTAVRVLIELAGVTPLVAHHQPPTLFSLISEFKEPEESVR